MLTKRSLTPSIRASVLKDFSYVEFVETEILSSESIRALQGGWRGNSKSNYFGFSATESQSVERNEPKTQLREGKTYQRVMKAESMLIVFACWTCWRVHLHDSRNLEMIHLLVQWQLRHFSFFHFNHFCSRNYFSMTSLINRARHSLFLCLG